MAYGDLIGDLSQAYMTNAERAAKNGVQSMTGGPIARASSQLPASAGLAAAAPVVAGQTAQPTQPAGQPASLADAAPKQTSFDATNTAPKYLPQQPQSLESVAPSASSSPPTVPSTAGQPASLADVSPAGPAAVPPAAPQQPVGLDSAYRPTGIGTGSNAIAARVGAGGIPQFSNQPADLASAAGATPVSTGQKFPTSLNELSPGGGTPNPDAPLASLGSAANLGDGVGTFSQAQAGDGQLAMTRFNRAADLRDAYSAQDRLKEAQAAQTRDNNFTVVHDSSQPVTRREIKFDQDRANTTQSLADAMTNAQGGVAAQRQGVALDQQQRQANRLEDAFTAATAPNATDADKQRYQNMKDPTGAGGLDRQIKQTQLANAQLEGKAKQQDIDQKTQSQQQSQQDRKTAVQGQISTVDQALASVGKLLGTKVDPKNPNGPRTDEDKGLVKAVGIRSVIPTVPGSPAADFEARNETLKAQTFLPQVSLLKGMGALSNTEGEKLGASIASLSTKQSPDAYRKSLQIIENTFKQTRDRLKSGTLITPGSNDEFAKPIDFGDSPQQTGSTAPGTLAAKPSASPTAPQGGVAGAPAVGSIQQGYVFLGGDPASQASWRKQ